MVGDLWVWFGRKADVNETENGSIRNRYMQVNTDSV